MAQLLRAAISDATEEARRLEVLILRTFWACVYIDF
jgi:hypothetical protein